MSGILGDSGYEHCEAVNKETEKETHPTYVELIDSTYDKIPDHHFNGQNSEKLKESQHEDTIPRGFPDNNLTDSLGYEIPIQGRPSGQLQPQRQHSNNLPELPRDTNLTDSMGYEIPIQGRPSSHLQPQRQQHNDLPELPRETTQRHQLETKVPNNQHFSKRSKRPFIVAVLVLTIIIIASGVATFLVFHFKEQENKPTMPTTSFHISTIMTTMASSVLSSVSTTPLIKSTPISQTMAPTTVSKTEAVDTSTTTTTVIPTTVITTTMNLTTTTVKQTANPVTTVPTTVLSTTPTPLTTRIIQTANPVTTVPSTETSTTPSPATTTVIQTTNPVTTVPTTEISTTPSSATTTFTQTTNPVTTVPTTETSTTPSPATTTIIQTANPVTPVPTTETSTTPSPATTTVIQTTHPAFTISSTGTFRDCQELNINGYRNDGVYTIYPYLSIQSPVRVYCDMRTDGGGWTVFQHRRDGSVDFYLPWDDYKNGFGEPDGEYWIGNDHLHQLTSWGNSDFYVRLEKFTGGWAFAKYNNFTVAGESDGYRMRLKVGSYRGNAGDSIESHGTTNANGYKFSTSDIDNDFAPASCTVARQGAWWHNICTWANLNGRYGNGSCIVSGNCNFWYSLTNSFSGVKTSFMMVRRVL